MNLIKQLKAVHWTAILLTLAGFGLAQLSKDPALAGEAPVLNWLAGILATGGVGTALGAHKVGFKAPGLVDTQSCEKAASRGFARVESMGWLTAIVVLSAAGALAACALLSEVGCTPAQSAKWSQVESTVLTDVEAGKSLTQIESDVAGIVIGADAPLVVTIVDDALTVLEDLGAFSLADKPYEGQVHQQAKADRVANAAKVHP